MAKTNYNKMSKKTDDVIETTTEVVEEVVETIDTPVEVAEPEYKKGVVIDCVKLNIRKAPKTNADIIGTLGVGSSVTIIDEVGDFYKIDLSENSYCMKKYISVK